MVNCVTRFDTVGTKVYRETVPNISNGSCSQWFGTVAVSGIYLAANPFEPQRPSTSARIGDPMNYRKVVGKRWLAVGMMIFFIFGCASNRGDAGVERSSFEPANRPDVSIAPKHEPPPPSPAPEPEAQYCYYYFPASEVYYSTWRRIYFYIEGDAWVADALLPYRLRAGLGGYKSLEIYADTPYEYHRYVYKKDYKAPAAQVKKKDNGGRY